MQLRFNKVINTLQYTNKLLFNLSIAYQDKKETIQATGNHPIYLKNKGFSAVDSIKTPSTHNAISARDDDLTLKTIQKTQQKAEVFDLTVEHTHTFFAGQLGLWVHNSIVRSEYRSPGPIDEFVLGIPGVIPESAPPAQLAYKSSSKISATSWEGGSIVAKRWGSSHLALHKVERSRVRFLLETEKMEKSLLNKHLAMLKGYMNGKESLRRWVAIERRANLQSRLMILYQWAKHRDRVQAGYDEQHWSIWGKKVDSHFELLEEAKAINRKRGLSEMRARALTDSVGFLSKSLF